MSDESVGVPDKLVGMPGELTEPRLELEAPSGEPWAQPAHSLGRFSALTRVIDRVACLDRSVDGASDVGFGLIDVIAGPPVAIDARPTKHDERPDALLGPSGDGAVTSSALGQDQRA